MNIDLKEIEFNVVRKLLVTEDGLKTDREAVVRTDSNTVVGVVSKTYSLLEHKTALVSVAQSIEKLESGFELKKVSVCGDGARMYATLEGREEMDMGKERKVGDLIRPQLILMNSIDGSTKLGFKIGALRLVCTNGMVRGETFRSISVKHTSGVDFDDVLAQGAAAMNLFHSKILPSWRDLTQTMVNKSFSILRLSDEKLGIPDRLNNRVVELTKEVDTLSLWDLYNHYTYSLTHEYRGSEERRVFLNGAVERIIQNLNVETKAMGEQALTVQQQLAKEAEEKKAE